MFSDSSEDEAEENVQLTVNEHYAKAFTYRKEREELEKLKEKYGSDFEESELEESTDSESAESEDEDGEELTPAVDAAILRTLARIRKKDPAIYDSTKSIFGEEAQNVSSQANTLNVGKKEKVKDKSKPVTVRQVNLEAVLHGSRSPSPEPTLPTHVEEQRALRDETIAAFHSAVPEDDDDDVHDLLIPREKTQDELVKEEEEYKAFLERQVGEDLRDLISVRGSDGEGEEEKEEGVKEDEGKKKKKKKSKGKGKEDKSKAEKDQEFLMNYILNRGWVDKAAQRLPTYSEITGSKRKGKRKGDDSDSDAMSVTHENQNQNKNGGDSENEDEDDAGLLSDASFESLASHFETSYNHRFEEPDATTIQTFPRNIESAVRRNDSARKEARERRKTRKEEELAKKREEVRRLKALKMKEIKRKLEKIGKEGGLLKGSKGKGDNKKKRRGDLEEEYGADEVDEALRELDLEGEWDPEKHDRQMQGLFANLGDGEFDGEEDGFGEEEEGMRFDEDGKPVWDDDIDIGDIEMLDDDARPVVPSSSSKKDKKKDKKKKKKRDEGGLEEGGVDVDDMDADRIVERRFEKDEEEWDGTEEMRKRKWDEYMNELYELDFNDMVAGMPTRFKYASIPSQNFSLDAVEILLADDQDLNEYMSIKKYAPYRKEKGDRSRWDPRQKDKLKAFRETLRERQKAWGMDVGEEGEGGGGEQGERPEKRKKRKGKKERMKAKGLNADEEDGDEDEDEKPVKKDNKEREEKKEKKKKRKLEEVVDEESGVDGVQAEDAAAPKKKHRRRHGKKDKAGAGDADEA